MTISLWLDAPYVPRPSLEGRQTADAVILGAGMTGVGLAHFLADRKVDTLVLERETVAGGATGRNAGLIVSGLGEHYARSVAFWGRSEAAAITRLHIRNHDLLAEIVSRYGIDCAYRRGGSFSVGMDGDEESELRRSITLLEEDGFACTFLEAQDMDKALGGRGFFGGIYNPLDGVINPVRLIRGLARAVEAAGVKILERSPVLNVVRAGAGWVVQSPHGSVTAPLLFLACNASLPLFRSQIPIKPVRGQCCAIAAPRSALPEMACVANYGAEYWRRAGHHHVFGGFGRLGGSGEFGYRDEVADVIQSALREFVGVHFPSLESAPASHRWSGIMAFTPDGLPVVGRMPEEDGLYLAGGYTGHGFGYAFLAGRWLAMLAVDEQDQIPALCRIERDMRTSPSLEHL